MENSGRTGTRTGTDLLVEARTRSLDEGRRRPHEQETVATIRDVEYINDSRSTYLDATLNAMASIERKVIWISGSLASSAARSVVQELLREKVRSIVLFGDEDGADIALGNEQASNIFFAKELRTAVFLARELAGPGDVVLFSPACPSGNGHANYEERGTEFRRAVKDL